MVGMINKLCLPTKMAETDNYVIFSCYVKKVYIPQSYYMDMLLYRVFMEMDWMPSVEQVKATLPSAFKEKFATAYAIIDSNEVFIETPSDFFMQSSTWRQYKQHNTVKFLVVCTLNGGICYISPVSVGSIFVIELTCRSDFLTKLEDKPGISIMAEQGFTIKDILKELGMNLNIPPF